MTLEWVTGEFMLRWLERVPGVTIERFGGAWGACAPDRPEVDFHNTVHRLLPDDLEEVPRIAELYAAARGAAVAGADAGAGLRTPGDRAP